MLRDVSLGPLVVQFLLTSLFPSPPPWVGSGVMLLFLLELLALEVALGVSPVSADFTSRSLDHARSLPV